MSDAEEASDLRKRLREAQTENELLRAELAKVCSANGEVGLMCINLQAQVASLSADRNEGIRVARMVRDMLGEYREELRKVTPAEYPTIGACVDLLNRVTDD